MSQEDFAIEAGNVNDGQEEKNMLQAEVDRRQITVTNTSTNTTSTVTPYALSSITEFPISTTVMSGPSNITAELSATTFWFTEFNSDKIGRITTAGVITEFGGLAPGAAPYGIVLGPDGNLWFTEFGTGKIGQMDTSGVLLNEYAVLTSGVSPASITVGPDGNNLWFTAFNPKDGSSSTIGQMDTSGNLLHAYALPDSLAMPVSITVGPDGALWFTEFGIGKIGRITTSGVINEFEIPSGAAPFGIALGVDGALWFTELNANKIGRLLRNGPFTHFFEYSIPTANSGPAQIVSVKDKGLVFTESFVGKIAQISLLGLVTEKTLSQSWAVPYGITTGNSGTVWFTEFAANKIGELTIS